MTLKLHGFELAWLWISFHFSRYLDTRESCSLQCKKGIIAQSTSLYNSWIGRKMFYLRNGNKSIKGGTFTSNFNNEIHPSTMPFCFIAAKQVNLQFLSSRNTTKRISTMSRLSWITTPTPTLVTWWRSPLTTLQRIPSAAAIVARCTAVWAAVTRISILQRKTKIWIWVAWSRAPWIRMKRNPVNQG